MMMTTFLKMNREMIIISNIENRKYVENVMIDVSSKRFGTRDYKGVIDVMAPSDYLIKCFWSDVESQVPHNIKISDYMRIY